MKTKWKFVVKYWDSIFYGGSDDLTIFDDSLEWAVLFFHENEIYWKDWNHQKKWQLCPTREISYYTELSKNKKLQHFFYYISV